MITETKILIKELTERKPLVSLIVIILIFLAYVLNILYSFGYHQTDEHFQILEFANYKLGKTNPSDLAWEFNAKIRPGLQPWITYIVTSLFDSLGVENRFHVVTFLRLFSALFAFIVFIKIFILFYHRIKSRIKDPNLKKYLLYLCFSFWFLPYCYVRFSSENWSSICFWSGFYLLIKYPKKILYLSLSGIFLALSFQFRYQMGLCITGLIFWIWVIRNQYKINKEILIPCVFMVFFIFFITYFIDYWLYGERVLPFINYFNINILQDKASEFGKSPFFIYLTEGAEAFILPFGIIIIFILLLFFFLEKKHPITWVLIPFILVHLVISHKELRFMFPIVSIIPIMLFISIIKLKEKFSVRFKNFIQSKKVQIWAKVYLVFNIILLLQRAVLPVESRLVIAEYANRKLKNKFNQVNFISYSPQNIFSHINLKRKFYKPQNMSETIMGKYGDPENKNYIKTYLNELKSKNINTFFINFNHHKLYGDNFIITLINSWGKYFGHTKMYPKEAPFPKDFLFMKEKCVFEYNMLENKFIKYNIYWVIRGISTIDSLFKCSL